MRISSGDTSKYIYFVAVDATDLKTRETGLTTFTVYRSRNGAAAALMTTPTVNETDATNMPGVYELLLDEDMTIGAGNNSEEMAFHITQADMSPVTRTIELYRRTVTSGNTLDVTATGAGGIDWGNVENKTTANDLSGTDIQLADTVTTLTGHTAQTGDNFSRLGAPAGASVSADIADIPTVSEFNSRTLLSADYFDPATDTVATVTTVANQVSADITAISGDVVAADNLESMYDGTGYTDDFAPATQIQLGNLSTGSAAISTIASGATVTVGIETLTYEATKQLDGSYHEIADDSGQIDVKYNFLVGSSGVASEVTFTGRLNGANDDLDIFGYNWVTTSWDQIGSFHGTNSTSDISGKFNLLSAHTGTGVDAGKVDLRAYKATGLTSAILYLDQVFLSYAVVYQDVGPDVADIQAQIGTAGDGLTDLGGMSVGMTAEVNAEVVDAISVDTYAEPGQGNPSSTLSLADKVNYIFKAWLNKSEQTATDYSLYNNAGTVVDQKATVSDNTVTATKGKVVTGP